MTPRVGSTRTAAGAPLIGTIGLPSSVWNRPVPLVPTHPTVAAQSLPTWRWTLKLNCSARGERKSLVMVVRVSDRGLAGTTGFAFKASRTAKPPTVPAAGDDEITKGKAEKMFKPMLRN